MPLPDAEVGALLQTHRARNGLCAPFAPRAEGGGGVAPPHADELVERCLLPLVNEGLRCLHAGQAWSKWLGSQQATHRCRGQRPTRLPGATLWAREERGEHAEARAAWEACRRQAAVTLRFWCMPQTSPIPPPWDHPGGDCAHAIRR